MQYFLDISPLIILVLTVVIYAKRGLIRSMVGAAKTIFSIILTYMFGGVVGNWLCDKVLQPGVSRFVCERLETMVPQNENGYDLSHVMDVVPDWLQSILQTFHVDVSALEEEYSTVTEGTFRQFEEFIVDICQPVTSFLSSVIGHAAVFLLSGLALAFLGWLLSKIADLPIIRTCDRVLGFVLGVLCAVLYTSLYVLVVYAVLGWLNVKYPTIGFTEAFETSYVFRFVYDWNLFRFLFGF